MEIARRSNEWFITQFLELFFPNFHPETIQRLQENIRFTISGLIRALHTVLKFRSLLDQIQKIFFTSENYMKFFYEKFPYTDQIDPFEAPKQVTGDFYMIFGSVRISRRANLRPSGRSSVRSKLELSIFLILDQVSFRSLLGLV